MGYGNGFFVSLIALLCSTFHCSLGKVISNGNTVPRPNISIREHPQPHEIVSRVLLGEGERNPRLLVITGPHKTACSTVQALLVDLRQALERDGALLCDNFHGRFKAKSPKAGANLAFDLHPHRFNRSSENIIEFQNCLSNKKFDTVIIASEEFDRMGIETHSPGAEIILTASNKIHAFIMLRDFPSWFTSLFKETNKPEEYTNHNFNMWAKKLMFDKSHYGDILKLNPYCVTKVFQDAGVVVTTFHYLDFYGLFCIAMEFPTVCDTFMKMSVPVKNAKNVSGSLCLEKAEFQALNNQVVTNYSVPVGMDLSSLMCM